MKLYVSMLSKIIIVILLLLLISCSSVDYIGYTGNHSVTNKSKNEISLITYNIEAIYDKVEGQIDLLMKYINTEKFDFVLFQELFDESTRDDVKNSNGIVHMILEKNISGTNDFLANKSIMGSLFAINDTTRLFLFNTHVQAIGTREHKQFQLKQIYSFINETVTKVVESRIVNSSENLIVILAGDFNSNAYSPESFRAMKNILGNPRDLHMEFNGNKKEYTWRFKSSRRPRRFDYILAYDNLGRFTFRKVAATTIGTKDVRDDQDNSISDHQALKAKIKLNI